VLATPIGTLTDCLATRQQRVVPTPLAGRLKAIGACPKPAFSFAERTTPLSGSSCLPRRQSKLVAVARVFLPDDVTREVYLLLEVGARAPRAPPSSLLAPAVLIIFPPSCSFSIPGRRSERTRAAGVAIGLARLAGWNQVVQSRPAALARFIFYFCIATHVRRERNPGSFEESAATRDPAFAGPPSRSNPFARSALLMLHPSFPLSTSTKSSNFAASLPFARNNSRVRVAESDGS